MRLTSRSRIIVRVYIKPSARVLGPRFLFLVHSSRSFPHKPAENHLFVYSYENEKLKSILKTRFFCGKGKTEKKFDFILYFCCLCCFFFVLWKRENFWLLYDLDLMVTNWCCQVVRLLNVLYMF
jgi:hypothetical protein